MATLFKASFYLRFIHLHIFPVLTSVIVTVECLTTWLLVVYFTPALKHMIQHDSKIQIRLLALFHGTF